MIQIKVGKSLYWAIDRDCKHRSCFAPGVYQHRAPTLDGGSRNTGAETQICMTNACQGCPRPKPEPERRGNRS
jgi:hypothetical protein